MITITAVLLNWKRPENIVKTIKSIRDQSISVKICLWNNNSDDKTKYDVDLQINSPNNFKCYPRWMMASLIETDYIFTLDDDLILADDNVIEDTLNLYKKINTNDKETEKFYFESLEKKCKPFSWAKQGNFCWINTL